MTESKKKNIIIGSLCAVVMLMVVGYAAFGTILNITGTSGITSNWDVRITDIREGTKVGTAATSLDENGRPIMSYDNSNGLTATFKTDLKSPGDKIEYIITVSNRGLYLDAKLDSINLTDSNNVAIKFETNDLQQEPGLKTLAVGESKEFKVTVEFLESVTSQPENLTSTVTLTLNYSQAEAKSETA